MDFRDSTISNSDFHDSAYFQGSTNKASNTGKTNFSTPSLSTIFGLGRVLLTAVFSPSQEEANQTRKDNQQAKESIQKSFSFRSYLPDLSALWAKASFPSFSFLGNSKIKENDPFLGSSKTKENDPYKGSSKTKENDPYEGRETFSGMPNPQEDNTTRVSISEDPDYAAFFKSATGDDFHKG